jgi:hypothetical protein
MCLGPYSLWANLPKPFRDIAWNCIVVALPIPLPCWKKSNSTTSTDQYPEWMNEVASNANSCNSFVWPSSISNWYAPSPFQLVWSSENSPNSTPVIPQNSYAFGFIQIDKDPIWIDEEVKAPEITIWWVKLQWWKNIKNQIKWWMVKWLKKLIIDNRLDRQIKYIMNNLTKMDITVYLPQIDDIAKWLNFWWDLKQKSEDFKKKNCEEKLWSRDKENNKCISKKTTICESQWGKWDDDNEKCFIEDKTKEKNINKEYCKLDWRKRDQQNEICNIPSTLQKIKNNQLASKSQLKSVSSTLSNPFDYMASLFNNTKLIKINQKNINIKVPMIYSEDINAYSSYLKQRKVVNLWEKDDNWNLIKEWIIHKWKNLIYWVIWMCAVDSKKIEEKEWLKLKWGELKTQFKKEWKALLETAKNEIKNININKNNPDIQWLKQCQKQFIPLDMWFYLSDLIFNQTKAEFIQANKSDIETLITNCWIDQAKINKLNTLEEKYNETKNQIKEAKKKIKDDTNLSTTWSNIIKCVDVFWKANFDVIIDSFISLDANTNSWFRRF